MSWFENDEMPCPACNKIFLGATAETINVSRMPEMRDRILDGTFNRVTCPHCGAVTHVDRAFLYSDMQNRHFVHVFPRTRAAGWPEWEEMAARVFADSFGNAPAVMREFAAGFQVRAVFGAAALADKLLVWDAGLDDAVVELVKLELFTSQAELRDRADVSLDVTGIDEPGGWIEVAATAPGGAPPALYGMRIARYRELMAHRGELMEKYMGLFCRPFVGFRRLAREVLAPELLDRAPVPEGAT